MLVIDIVVIVILLIALVVGVQRGFLAVLGSLAGLAVGGLAAFWLVPFVNQVLPLTPWRGWILVAAAVGLLVLGTGIGSAIGMAIRRGVDRTKLRGFERLLGGAMSLLVGALSLSLVAQTVAATGMPVLGAAMASSRVLRVIEDLTPSPVTATLAELRGTVLADGLPRLGELLGPGITPTSPDVALDDPALTTAAQSVARVSGVAYACGTSVTGSGFAIGPDLVVTNAHVVAGVDRPVVELPGRAAREGRIVYFDPVDDLAVVAVDDLGAAPLAIAPVLAVGASAVVQGYPHGGPFTTTAAQVLSVGTAPVPDIYAASSAPREVYSLDAVVRPGNSGGPLLSVDGEVAGVVFARSDADEDLGYAMTTTELLPLVAQSDGLEASVDSGECAG